MKIISVDNFGRETIDDTLVADNVNKYYGQDIVDNLNDMHSGDHSQYFFRLVEDDYKLFAFEP